MIRKWWQEKVFPLLFPAVAAAYRYWKHETQVARHRHDFLWAAYQGTPHWSWQEYWENLERAKEWAKKIHIQWEQVPPPGILKRD